MSLTCYLLSLHLFFRSFWICHNNLIRYKENEDEVEEKFVNFLTNSYNYKQIRAKKLNKWIVKQSRNIDVTIVLEERIACEMRTGYFAISGWQARLTERAKTRTSAVHSAAWCSHLACWLPYLTLQCESDWQIQYKYHKLSTILVSVSVQWWGCLCGGAHY